MSLRNQHHGIEEIGQELEAQSTGVTNPKSPEAATPSRKTKLKIDIRLIVTVGIVYALSVIDRINIGQAKVVGMSDELHLDEGNRYNIALLVFFPAYLLGEFPSNLALVKFGVANTLTGLLIGIGCFTIGQGHVNSWQGLAAMRFFVGLFEAGVFPAVILLCASWYPRYEVHKRVALLYSIGLVASGFAGVLAYAIGLMDGDRGWRGWRWIFTIEGAVTIAVAFLLHFFIDDFPDRAKFLTEDEKKRVISQIETDRGNAETEKLAWKHAKELKDWTLWLTTWMYFCNVVAVYGLAYFVPSIIASLGYSGVMAALLSAPQYVAGLCFLVIGAVIGDRIHRRLPIIIAQTMIGIVGLALMSQPQLPSGARYAGTYLAIAACQANNAAILIFGQNNVVGSAKMNIASMLNISSGTLAGIVGSTIYTTDSAPRYLPGLSTTMALNACLIITCAIAWTVLGRKNRRADKECAVYYNVPRWRYTL